MRPESGLSFAWSFKEGATEGTFSGSFSPDGVGIGHIMYIYWKDLQLALTELLGYSERHENDTGPSEIRRNLPWQHPFYSGMWLQKISGAKGIILQGTNTKNTDGDDFVDGEDSAGAGYTPPTGPWTEYGLAELTLQWWRPPYFVRSDSDINIQDPANPGHTRPAEWLRYVDKHWQVSTQFLTREGSTYIFTAGQGLPPGKYFQGSVGQKVVKATIERTWYQVPEACIFGTLTDGTPNGLPINLLYTQTSTANFITGNVYPGRTYNPDGTINFVGSPTLGCVNTPVGAGLLNYFGPYTVTNKSTTVSGMTAPVQASLFVGDVINGMGIPIGATISQFLAGNDGFVMSLPATQNSSQAIGGPLTFISDGKPDNRWFGCYAGTLLLSGIKITPRPLQLPPLLMVIGIFGNNEPISQLQYDVTFQYELFDPPKAPATSAGTIAVIVVKVNGAGYEDPQDPTSVNPANVVFSGGGGTGAAAVPRVSNGRITGVVITNAGTGYTSPPAVAITPRGAVAVVSMDPNLGQLLPGSIQVVSGGFGYLNGNTGNFPVSFTGGGTNPTQATATAMVTNGVIQSVTLNTFGAGYTSRPTVVIPGNPTTIALAVSQLVTAVPSQWARGHNLFPFSGNGYYYPAQSQLSPITTAFQYMDMSDLFIPL
jgi:hypothetical protein